MAGAGGLVLEFDLGGETPRGRAPDLKKRAQVEALKKEPSSRVRGSLLKLKDRDTQQQALLDMQKVCEELKPDQSCTRRSLLSMAGRTILPVRRARAFLLM